MIHYNKNTLRLTLKVKNTYKEIKQCSVLLTSKSSTALLPRISRLRQTEQTKADQHLQGTAFHTWVEAEDRPLMTHSHLEWTCSAGNRPETQPLHGPKTWWCLLVSQTNPTTAERDKPPTMSQSYKPNMIEVCYSLSYNADTITEWSVQILQHTSVSWCAVQWYVITL